MTKTYDFFCDNGGEFIIDAAEFDRDSEHVELWTGASGNAYARYRVPSRLLAKFHLVSTSMSRDAAQS